MIRSSIIYIKFHEKCIDRYEGHQLVFALFFFRPWRADDPVLCLDVDSIISCMFLANGD